jgi:glycosyltransferase involved in cell wall biosynthesis
MLFERLRRYDETTIDNVDRFVSNSENVRKRILNHYDREASVVYPPIEDAVFARTPQFKSGETPEYYVSFGAVTPYKRIDLLVEAFNESGEQLVVIGDGSERSRLEKIAGSNITFTGFLSDEQVYKTLIKAKALLFPGEEDFGMIPLEVMALGIPVIAYAAGGALETVIENKEHLEESTGLFFNTQSSTSILEAVERFEKLRSSYSPEFIRNHALTFHEIVFKKRMLEQVKALLG